MHFKLGRLSSFVSVSGLAALAALAACDNGSESSTGGVGGAASGAATGGNGVAGSVASGGTAGTSAGGSSAGAGASALGGQAGGGGGATGGSGQAGGGTGSGGGGAGGSASCAYKLCEDFESGTETTLPAGWTSFKGYGVASAQDQVVTTSEFHSGAKALQSTSATKGISRIQKDLASLGATASKHWGRIYYKVKSPAAQISGGYLHVTFVSLFGASENRVVDTVEGPDGKHQWLFNNPNDQGGKASSYDWTFDADWHCAEWFVDVGTKSYRFFSDSKEVTEIAFTGQDNQMSDYKTLIVGATHYQENTLSPPFVVWFDDLAINDTQIGCQ